MALLSSSRAGSMSGEAEGHIEVGDLILVGETRPEELEVGDVITYTSGGSTVTHRITAIALQEDGSRLFTTKGDANDGEDTQPVTEEQLVGVCWGRIPRAGEVALFFQTPLGMLLFVALPLAAFVAYDILRRQRDAGREREKVREMEAELSRLRSLAGEGEPREGPGEEPPDDHPRNPRGEGGHGPADTAG